MGFMKPQIVPDGAWQIETTEGTEIVPFHVCGAYDVKLLQQYCSGEIRGAVNANYQIEKLPKGYVYRLSAPGYLDCTEWGYASTEGIARIHLSELYGDNEE